VSEVLALEDEQLTDAYLPGVALAALCEEARTLRERLRRTHRPPAVRPNGGHRCSALPWYRCPARVGTMSTAGRRLRSWGGILTNIKLSSARVVVLGESPRLDKQFLPLNTGRL